MANLEITDFCNMRCEFCFAIDHMTQQQSNNVPRYISIDKFEEHLDFLERSNIDQIRLIGGEPTLHPQFSKLIDRSQLRGKHIVVFTNGIMPKKALERLKLLPPEECTILINMSASNSKGGLSEREAETQKRSIFTLGPRVVFGYNIYKTNFNLAFLSPIIHAAGSRKEIRLGLAHPILSGNNSFLHPKQYEIVGKKIVQVARLASDYGISLSFDCGFVRCMFSDEDLQILKEVNSDIGWRCNPILDITLDGNATHCYPLGEKLNLPVLDRVHAAALRKDFEDRFSFLRPIGIYPECSTCPFKATGECTGGCLGITYRRLRRSSIKISVPEHLLIDA